MLPTFLALLAPSIHGQYLEVCYRGYCSDQFIGVGRCANKACRDDLGYQTVTTTCYNYSRCGQDTGGGGGGGGGGLDLGGDGGEAGGGGGAL